MTSILPKILTATVTPGEIIRQPPFPYNTLSDGIRPYIGLPSRVVYSYTTDVPFGKPTNYKPPPVQQMVPKATGDERNNNPLMKVLQQAMQKQNVDQTAPIAKAQEQYRDWR